MTTAKKISLSDIVVLIILLIFIIGICVWGKWALEKLHYESEIPNYSYTSAKMDEDYHLLDLGSDTSTSFVIYYNTSSPLFVEDEWINTRLWVSHYATFPEGIDNVQNLGVRFYLIDEYGNPAKAKVDYGLKKWVDVITGNITYKNHTMQLFDGRIDVEYLNKTGDSGDGALFWQSDIKIKFGRTGSYGVRVETYLPGVYGTSIGWVNNTIDVKSTLEKLQMMAIYEQQETNAKTVGLSHLSILIAVCSIVFAAFSKVIRDALKAIYNALIERGD